MGKDENKDADSETSVSPATAPGPVISETGLLKSIRKQIEMHKKNDRIVKSITMGESHLKILGSTKIDGVEFKAAGEIQSLTFNF